LANFAKNLLALPDTTFCSCKNKGIFNKEADIQAGKLPKLPIPITSFGLVRQRKMKEVKIALNIAG